MGRPEFDVTSLHTMQLVPFVSLPRQSYKNVAFCQGSPRLLHADIFVAKKLHTVVLLAGERQCPRGGVAAEPLLSCRRAHLYSLVVNCPLASA